MKHPVDELAEVREAIRLLQQQETELRRLIINSGDQRGVGWWAEIYESVSERFDLNMAKAVLGLKLTPYFSERSTTHVRLRPLDQRDDFDNRWLRKRRERPIPPLVRAAVLKRANGHCEECGIEERVELHHLTYRCKIAEDNLIFGFETEKDLAALCRDCHSDRHIGPTGKYFLDPEECAKCWRDKERFELDWYGREGI